MTTLKSFKLLSDKDLDVSFIASKTMCVSYPKEMLDSPFPLIDIA